MEETNLPAKELDEEAVFFPSLFLELSAFVMPHNKRHAIIMNHQLEEAEEANGADDGRVKKHRVQGIATAAAA
jgi:hypothetical protein